MLKGANLKGGGGGAPYWPAATDYHINFIISFIYY